MDQIGRILDADLPRGKKIDAIVRIVSMLALQGGLIALSVKDLGAVRQRVGTLLGEEVTRGMQSDVLHSLNLLDDAALKAAAGGSPEALARLARLARADARLANRLAAADPEAIHGGLIEVLGGGKVRIRGQVHEIADLVARPDLSQTPVVTKPPKGPSGETGGTGNAEATTPSRPVRPTGSYAERQRALANDPQLKSHEAFTVGEIPPGKAWEYITDAAHWIPERRALHQELVTEAYQAANQLANRMPPKTVVMMRGNTAAGKTTTVRESSNETIRGLNLSDLGQNPVGVLNPDTIKHQLVQRGGQATGTQVLQEGAMLTQQLVDRLIGEGKSLVIDKRFLEALSVQKEVVGVAKANGYRVVLMDVDASLSSSAERVAQRPIGGADPNVPWDAVEEGFIHARRQRVKVAELAGIDEYVLVKTDGPKKGTVIAERKNGRLEIHDQALWREVTTVDEAEILRAKEQWKAIVDERAKGKEHP